jgi:hypothetical protein
VVTIKITAFLDATLCSRLYHYRCLEQHAVTVFSAEDNYLYSFFWSDTKVLVSYQAFYLRMEAATVSFVITVSLCLCNRSVCILEQFVWTGRME